MSDTPPRRRIRAQYSAQDPDIMGFVLDHPVQGGSTAQLQPGDDAPLAHALFDLAGVAAVTVAQATLWVQRHPDADWTRLKPEIAAAIRTVLDSTDSPLGDLPSTDDKPDPDEALLHAVKDLLDRQVNPSVAAHGGHIAADRVEGGAVYLRMSGGCQGCAASSATLRDGVERMLRAALPQITTIVDVTDHASGRAPFYAPSGQAVRLNGASPLLLRPVPPGVIDRQDGRIMVDPEYLAPRLGLTVDSLRAGLRNGDVVGVTESGEGEDMGKTRITMRSTTRAWAAEIDPDGSAREIPPPRRAASGKDDDEALATRARAYLEDLSAAEGPVTYGTLARALGLWMPGSIRKLTRALEVTMREDAAAGRPFIAARAISRGRDGLPGEGFFSLARSLGRGPADGESDREFLAREVGRLLRSTA